MKNTYYVNGRYTYDPKLINTIEDCEAIPKNELQDFFITSCLFNKSEIIKILLSNPQFSFYIDINKPDNDDCTAMNALAGCAHVKSLEVLLQIEGVKEKINPHIKNKKGWNPLMFAVGNYFHKTIELLIYDFNIEIDEETMEWLKGKNEISRVYTEVLKMIEKRDLYNNLNNSISISQTPNKMGNKI